MSVYNRGLVSLEVCSPTLPFVWVVGNEQSNFNRQCKLRYIAIHPKHFNQEDRGRSPNYKLKQTKFLCGYRGYSMPSRDNCLGGRAWMESPVGSRKGWSRKILLRGEAEKLMDRIQSSLNETWVQINLPLPLMNPFAPSWLV